MAEEPRPATSLWVSPKVVLPVLGVLLLIALLLTPTPNFGREGDPRLTTHSTSSQGARAFYEVTQRLGWQAEQRTLPFRAPLDTGFIYAVLAPPLSLTAMEVHALLDAVRRGASLLFVATPGSVLADSLHLKPSTLGGPMEISAEDTAAACDSVSDGGIIRWPGQDVYLLSLVRQGPRSLLGDTTFISIRRGAAATSGRRDSAESETERQDSDSTVYDATKRASAGRLPAALGFSLGRGRVVVLSDPDLLRNDVIRTCRWNVGVQAIAMLHWLDPTHGRPIVFDEYHQGYGSHASVGRAVRQVLLHTPPGRALAQLLGALAILIIAVGVRALAPLPRVHFERRSPLEHVGALSRAYEQVGASRLATRRLVRGLRRRYTSGLPSKGRWESDEDFLRSIASRFPSLEPDVALLLDALTRPLPSDSFLAAGRAIVNIERTLHQ